MRRTVILLTICINTTAVLAAGDFDLDLEPCINGGVSATGTYVDQALEDEMLRLSNLEQIDEYALEPCINGGVSESGLYASQAEEDAVGQSIASRD